MIAEYFSIMGVLFVLYLCLRSAYSFSEPFPWSPWSRPRVKFEGRGVNAAEISARIQQVRQNLANAKEHSSTADFKRASLVASKREQISHLAYFQRPPASVEPTDADHGHTLFLA